MNGPNDIKISRPMIDRVRELIGEIEPIEIFRIYGNMLGDGDLAVVVTMKATMQAIREAQDGQD